MRLTASQLYGLDSTKANLMGKPHLGACYTAHDYRRYSMDDGALCAVCGRPATDVHHVVPKSSAKPRKRKGAGGDYTVGWTLNTPLGAFSVLSPLFALCRECHEAFHARRLSVRWEYATDDDERDWWSGRTLATECTPHSALLFDRGGYIIEDETGKETRPWQTLGS